MITITRGDDRNINLYLLRTNKRPFDLTGWTNISVYFKKQDSSLLEKNTTLFDIPAYAEYQNVLFSAVVGGTSGNSIVLTFDGVKTISQVLTDWNTLHPLNTATSDSENPNGTVLPAAVITFSNGLSSQQDVRVVSELLGHIVCTVRDTDTAQMMLGKALTFKVTVDKGAPTAGERRNIMFYNQLEVVDDRF